MFKKVSVLFALIAAVTFFAAPQQAAAAAGDVFVDVHGPAVNHNGVFDGSAFQVDVVAEGISDPDGLAGGSFELNFDDSILSVHDPDPNADDPNDPEIGADLSDNSCSFESNEPSAGVLRVAFTCTTPEVISGGANVILATVVFETNVQGTSTATTITVANPFLNDADTATGPNPIDTTLTGQSTTVDIVAGTCGDQDGNDTINTIDATIDALFAIGTISNLTSDQLVLSDVARDGDVNVGDVTATLQHIVGSIDIGLSGCGPADPLAAP